MKALPTALVCGTQDAWGANDEYWTADYDGMIPGTITGGTRLIEPDDPDSLTGIAPELVAEGSDFCAHGVLGREDIADAYASCDDGAGAEDEIFGDQALITDPIVPGRLQTIAMDTSDTSPVHDRLKNDKDLIGLCKETADAMVNDTTLRLGFEIRRAYRDRLVLSVKMPAPIGKLQSLADINACLAGRPWNIEVHTLGSFSVVGNDSGFLHRVHANAEGRCVVDPEADALHQGRARVGCPFRNPKLQFEFRKLPAGSRLASNVGLQLVNTNPAVKLILNGARAGFSSATVVPAQLRYNDIDRRLYLVDISDRGLVPIPLSPFPPSVDASGSFN